VSDSRRDIDIAYARKDPPGTRGQYLRKYDCKRLLQRIDELGAQDHAVLIIEDIDAEVYHELCARYSSSIDAEFLAQHVLRMIDLESIFHSDHSHMKDIFLAYVKLAKRVRARFSRTDPGSSNRQQPRRHHIHGTIEIHREDTPGVTMSSGNSVEDGYRRETLTRSPTCSEPQRLLAHLLTFAVMAILIHGARFPLASQCAL
jgi:hypothetical protein